MKPEGRQVVQAEAAEAARQKADPAEWANMSDVQRTQWCLRSTRLHDTEQFRKHFGSWNGPDPDMAFTNPTAPGTERK